MTAGNNSVLHVQVDPALKQAFEAAAQREKITHAELLRQLMRDFAHVSKRDEARRQSRFVASAPDATETMDLLMEVQGLQRD